MPGAGDRHVLMPEDPGDVAARRRHRPVCLPDERTNGRGYTGSLLDHRGVRSRSRWLAVVVLGRSGAAEVPTSLTFPQGPAALADALPCPEATTRLDHLRGCLVSFEQLDLKVVGHHHSTRQIGLLFGLEVADGAAEQVHRNGDDVVESDGALVI